ncbi:MAG: dockerin type I repeat-containing protein, partial [Oscillospiraceae bacterium]|nr:dockerin type I repeat-containing protein [Oscillospiraceae bacterium]
SKIVVAFDEYFTDTNQDQVKAVVDGDEAQWQPNWWVFSEKQGDKGTDVVVNYSKVTLVYEYDNTEKLTGGVNEDGKINVSDVVALSKWLINVKTAKIDGELADVIADDKINVFDLIALKRIVINNK